MGAIDHLDERLGRIEPDLCREDRGVPLEALFRAEREPDAVPLIEPASADEPVQPRVVRQNETDRPQDEVEQLIREAIHFHLDGLREAGEPIPEPTAVGTTLVEVPAA